MFINSLASIDGMISIPNRNLEIENRGFSIERTNIPEHSNYNVGPRLFGFYNAFNNHLIVPSRNNVIDVNSMLSQGTLYGIGLAYDFNNRKGISIEWIMNATQNQSFEYLYTTGDLKDREVKLSYTQIPLLLHCNKEISFSLFDKEIGVSKYAGVQYGFLKSAEINIDNKVQSPYDFLKKHQLGLVVGLDYSIPLTTSYAFSLGARGSISTNLNYFKADAFEVFNATWGLKAGLHYNFNH